MRAPILTKDEVLEFLKWCYGIKKLEYHKLKLNSWLFARADRQYKKDKIKDKKLKCIEVTPDTYEYLQLVVAGRPGWTVEEGAALVLEDACKKSREEAITYFAAKGEKLLVLSNKGKG